jgi:hypothetical protein
MQGSLGMASIAATSSRTMSNITSDGAVWNCRLWVDQRSRTITNHPCAYQKPHPRPRFAYSDDANVKDIDDDEFANCGAGFGGMFRLLGRCVVRSHELDWRYVWPALRIHLKTGIRETFRIAAFPLLYIWLFFLRAMMRGSFRKRPMPPRKPGDDGALGRHLYRQHEL